MKRPFGFRLACAGLCLAAQAVAAATVDVRSHGAQGDGVTDDTAALQRAIDACAAQGGGRVVVPGGVYKTYTLSLKSDVDLHLERGATLKGGEGFFCANPALVAKGFVAADGTRAVCVWNVSRQSQPVRVDGLGEPSAAFAPAGTPTAGDIPANSLRLLVFDLRVKAFATFQESSLSH